MKCLRKYEWVKLPRNYPDIGKGIMGHWAKLASRAAFRKGNTKYCGHINTVTPGMWAGGVVGLKSMLGVKSRTAAIDVLDQLSKLGYLRYRLDRQTKKLTYEISDWVVKCSGAACMEGAAYTTEGYGFLCMPRNITERLYDGHHVFGEADAWLDLWCHTIFGDKGNAFSCLCPVIQYGKYGAVLTLEKLGQRWGWEKTKVWRFFKKHSDVFTLQRLPSSFGCLVFNSLYPAGVDVQVPSQDQVVSIMAEILISGNYKYKENSENTKLNHMVAWHSAKVVEARQAESALLEGESRVAPSAPIIRTYISHGWNCKHCRNCQYACRGVITGKPPDLSEGSSIRGPCTEKNSTTKWRKDDEI